MKLPLTLTLTLLLLLLTTIHTLSPPPKTNLPTPQTFTSPPFCDPLFHDPQPLPSNCNLNKSTYLCRDGRHVFFSQMKQDYYLYTRHFRNLSRRGVYIDAATNDPISISNTFFFDKCLGWSGLCVEGNPSMIQAIHSVRSCAVLPTCVGERDGEKVEFVLDGGLSGVKGTNKNKRKWKRAMGSVERVCTNLKRALWNWGVHVVDYLSLDVEGHELYVLKGIEWGRVRINVITVEVTKESLDGVERFLKGKGFVRHWPDLKGARKSGLLNEDAVFLYKDVVWGEPK